MIFNRDNIIIVDKVSNWEEAVKLGAKPLLELGKIKKEYIEKMIESINKLGFYVVLSDHIAMPHARPEDGVIETGLSFLKINEPVKFGDDDIYLVFTLAAKDKDSHIDTIGELLEILQDDEKIKKLIASKNIEEILEIIK